VTLTREQSHLTWRITFALAALYNLAFGGWAIVAPFGFFDAFDLARPVYPGIWSCLGMVIGVYGLGYAYIAWKPEHGDVLALLGLIGKVLGPIGWLIAVHNGDLPPRTFPLILLNDLVWWYPFTAYLLRRSSKRRTLLTWLVVAVHAAASAMLLLVSAGTEAEANIVVRSAFIASHIGAWVTCWLLWVAASLGLMMFFLLWAKSLAERGAARLLLVASCVVAFIGLCFDLSNEIILITKLTDPLVEGDVFAYWARRATVFGAGFGNGYYCVAGVLMTIIAWHAGFLRGWLLMLGIAVWVCGLALSAAAFAEAHVAMIAFGAALMMLFIPWAALVGLRFAGHSSSHS
jgi:hypothetical protein